MITIKLEIDDIDYDSLVDQFLPIMTEKLRQSNNPVAMLLSNGMPASMAKTIIKGLPRETKDKLTADLLNTYQEQLKEKAEEFARQQSIPVSIQSISASIE